MSFTVRSDSANMQKVNIFIEGDLIVRDAAEIKNALVNFLQNHNQADVYLHNISRIDIAGLQLLAALKKGAVISGKTFQLFADHSIYLQNILAISGYNNLF